jgi:hypothetical protein
MARIFSIDMPFTLASPPAKVTSIPSLNASFIIASVGAIETDDEEPVSPWRRASPTDVSLSFVSMEAISRRRAMSSGFSAKNCDRMVTAAPPTERAMADKTAVETSMVLCSRASKRVFI